jgi:sulfur carrier protein
MTIVLNGDRRDVPDGVTVARLLDVVGIDPRIVAVEVDGAIVRRADWSGTVLTEGAEVEIVSFVGGGGRRPPPHAVS